MSLCTPPTDNANPLWVTPLLPTFQTFDQVRTDVHYKVRLSYTLLGNKEEYHSFRHKCRSKKNLPKFTTFLVSFTQKMLSTLLVLKRPVTYMY